MGEAYGVKNVAEFFEALTSISLLRSSSPWNLTPDDIIVITAVRVQFGEQKEELRDYVFNPETSDPYNELIRRSLRSLVPISFQLEHAHIYNEGMPYEVYLEKRSSEIEEQVNRHMASLPEVMEKATAICNLLTAELNLEFWNHQGATFLIRKFPENVNCISQSAVVRLQTTENSPLDTYQDDDHQFCVFKSLEDVWFRVVKKPRSCDIEVHAAHAAGLHYLFHHGINLAQLRQGVLNLSSKRVFVRIPARINSSRVYDVFAEIVAGTSITSDHPDMIGRFPSYNLIYEDIEYLEAEPSTIHYCLPQLLLKNRLPQLQIHDLDAAD